MTQINPLTGNPMNPKTFTITDPTLAADTVTGFKVLLGKVKGGPYTLVSTAQALTSLTTNPDGTITGTFVNLHEVLAPGTWYCVAEAENTVGDSANSPEAAFDIVPPPPAAPTGFSVS